MLEPLGSPTKPINTGTNGTPLLSSLPSWGLKTLRSLQSSKPNRNKQELHMTYQALLCFSASWLSTKRAAETRRRSRKQGLPRHSATIS